MRIKFFDERKPDGIKNEVFDTAWKNLSFSYYDDELKETLAYIAVTQQSFSNDIENKFMNKNGCRIIDLYVKPQNVNNYKRISKSILSKLFEEFMFYASNWCIDGEFAFNYVWFDRKDFDRADDLTSRIKDIKHFGDVGYILLK